MKPLSDKLSFSLSAAPQITPPGSGDLFARVASILEQARSNVVRSVNSNMVLAYWLVGREIVQEFQGGKYRAEYGKRVLAELSHKLNKMFCGGYSVTSLKYFRSFYLVYAERLPEIGRPAGDQFGTQEKGRLVGDQSLRDHSEERSVLAGFAPQLSWSHYRALMRVVKGEARLFYEQEAIACCWDKRALERHIHSQYYERLLRSQNPKAMLQSARDRAKLQYSSADILKNPYVLEFLGLPDSSTLHETELESAIINHLQTFLLELGKGFAFVGRQKRLRFDDTDLYVDLVFYNCILKCYLLIDLKMGELSYRDVGQIDGYVRMFDDLYTTKDDNPTIGLILCTEKNEAVARYSVLSERKQIFASKYMLYLPTEEELKRELERERMMIEATLEDRNTDENPMGIFNS